jgi:hypothetical protein
MAELPRLHDDAELVMLLIHRLHDDAELAVLLIQNI